MDSIKKILFVLLVASLILAGCKIKTTETPTIETTAENTPVPTETDADVEDVIPTEVLPLIDEDGKMICEIVPGFLSNDSDEKQQTYALIGDVSESDWVIGPENAKLTIIEYSDFQCPACKSAYASLEQLMEDYPDDIRLVFRHFPLKSIHPNAFLATQAAEAAGKQGKFWDMYVALFDMQSDWSSLSTEDFTSWLSTKAEAMDLDAVIFSTDLTSDAVVQKVSDGYDKAASIGLSGTPTMFVNGNYMGSLNYYTMTNLLKVYDYESSMYTECPDWVIDTEKSYTTTIETQKGDVVLELFADKTPLTVNSFVFLAQEGYFDDITFHRVMYDFVAQSGDPTGTGFANPGYQFRNEIIAGLNFDSAGFIGMANAGENTNGSQFFITYGAAEDLNDSYTIFGKVIEGMDVLAQLTERNPQVDPNPPAGDRIITITIEDK